MTCLRRAPDSSRPKRRSRKTRLTIPTTARIPVSSVPLLIRAFLPLRDLFVVLKCFRALLTQAAAFPRSSGMQTSTLVDSNLVAAGQNRMPGAHGFSGQKNQAALGKKLRPMPAPLLRRRLIQPLSPLAPWPRPLPQTSSPEAVLALLLVVQSAVPRAPVQLKVAFMNRLRMSIYRLALRQKKRKHGQPRRRPILARTWTRLELVQALAYWQVPLVSNVPLAALLTVCLVAQAVRILPA